MNPWKPGAPEWWSVTNGERNHDPDRQFDLDEAVTDYLENAEECERIPAVLALRGFVDDCDNYAGEDHDCSDEDEHEIRSYARAFIPTWPWCCRNGWGEDEELRLMIETNPTQETPP